MSDVKSTRTFDFKLARGWVFVQVTVTGPSNDANATPENLEAVGKVIARLGKAIGRIQSWAENNTTGEK